MGSGLETLEPNPGLLSRPDAALAITPASIRARHAGRVF